MENELEVIVETPLVIEETELDKDLIYTRKMQLNIIQEGHDSLKTLVQVASQSQHPRAYEVLSQYLKTLSELNRDLIAIAERKSYKDEEKPKAPVGPTVNNLFVGSTAELSKMLAGLKDD